MRLCGTCCLKKHAIQSDESEDFSSEGTSLNRRAKSGAATSSSTVKFEIEIFPVAPSSLVRGLEAEQTQCLACARVLHPSLLRSR